MVKHPTAYNQPEHQCGNSFSICREKLTNVACHRVQAAHRLKAPFSNGHCDVDIVSNLSANGEGM